MITCTLGEKKYTVDYVKGRAFREIDDALKVSGRLVEIANAITTGQELSEEARKMDMKAATDTLVKWFCILFDNQFTPDEVYDGYPADVMIPDINRAIAAVSLQMTNTLSEFPTKPTARKTTKK